MEDVTHEKVQDALLDLVSGSELPEALSSHLHTCEACQSFADAVLDLDGGLAELAVFEAPAALLERTQEAVDALTPELQARPESVRPDRVSEAPRSGLFGAIFGGLFSGLWALLGLLVAPFRSANRRTWAIAIPAVAALGLVFVGGLGTLTLFVGSEADEAPMAVDSLDEEEQSLAFETAVVSDPEPTSGFTEFPTNTLDEVVDAPAPASEHWHYRGETGREANAAAPGRFANDGTVALGSLSANRADLGREADTDRMAPETEPSVQTASERRARRLLRSRAARRADADGDLTGGDFDLRSRDQGLRGSETGEVFDVMAEAEPAAPVIEEPNARREGERRGLDFAQRIVPGADANNRDREAEDSRSQLTQRLGWGENARAEAQARPTLLPQRQAQAGARATRQQTEGLTFRSPTGYWANTYLPGDSAMRSLRRRLADDPVALRLADLASPAEPAFEAPRSGALALSVSSDTAQVEGRTRVLMSVGVRGAAQRAGRRPSLRTQVLLDLRQPLDEGARGRVRALLSALSRRHEASDEVGLIVAGPDGGTRIELGSMRHGQVTVALRRIFGERPADASALDLSVALSRAVSSISQLDEDAPLGSSMVLLLTPSLSDADAHSLASVAHTGALAGVNTTVVALDSGAPLAAIERVALAGQGRRRVMDEARNADDLVRDEIAAVSRVVARAVRLRIRLAEGVQLVDVLGSHSLNEQQAERVRQAEQAVDRALAARLGIVSDRGDDEDGIQIVVPAFYADDTHHVLLDLVVPGPGPVADVQARFKDLLRLGNGTLTDRLVLTRGMSARGPAQRAVYAAGLGFEVASAMRMAATQLESGQPQVARATLTRASARLDSATLAMPELASMPALARDVSLCRNYQQAISSGSTGELAASLRYAAHRRLLGDPLGLGGEP